MVLPSKTFIIKGTSARSRDRMAMLKQASEHSTYIQNCIMRWKQRDRSSQKNVLSVDWDNRIKKSKSSGDRRESVVKIPMVLREKIFFNGSSYEGHWSLFSMENKGAYRILNEGPVYEGEFEKGEFHGLGDLVYPNGAEVIGRWRRGKLIKYEYKFPDSKLHENYRRKSAVREDRRYFTEILGGIPPAGRSQLTNDHPPKLIPEGCYDVGEGFYCPEKKWIFSYDNPDFIIRSPSAKERRWIVENCRKAWDEPTGYRPDMYQFWNENYKDVWQKPRNPLLRKFHKTEEIQEFVY